jgi:ABC-type multidrug transport system fused ATPase/permease subunit
LEQLYDIDSGCVLMDGKPIDSIDTRWLRQKIGFVEQQPVLFNKTIKDNLVMVLNGLDGSRDVPQCVIEEATKAANAHEFILALQNGQYDSI